MLLHFAGATLVPVALRETPDPCYLSPYSRLILFDRSLRSSWTPKIGVS